MVERLSLRLGPSRLLAAMLGGAHVVAAAALWLAPIPVVYALACSVALVVHLAWVVRRHALRTDAGALIELEVVDGGSVSVSTRAGVRRVYRVGGSSFVSPVLTVLNLRSETGRARHHVLVAADSVDANGFRRLRVWLRWRSGEQDAGLAQTGMASRR
jgi:toxin CptA